MTATKCVAYQEMVPQAVRPMSQVSNFSVTGAGCMHAERGGQRYHHMLDGDGYVCRFSFAGGNNVHFLSRYVQTR